jgi:transcription antitermination factor NusG
MPGWNNSTAESVEVTDGTEWYALRVMVRAERRVAAALERKGREVLLPLRRDGKVHEALFPGYLFCQFNPRFTLPILTTPGVQHIVGYGSKPAPLHVHEVEALNAIVVSNAPVEPFRDYLSGQAVTITEGPLRGIRAVVARVHNTERVLITVELLQRSVLLDTPIENILPCESYSTSQA